MDDWETVWPKLIVLRRSLFTNGPSTEAKQVFLCKICGQLSS